MLVECFIILILIISIILMSLRMHKKKAALESLPVVFVPLMNIVANYASVPISRLLPVNGFSAYSGFIVLGIIISSMLAGLFANCFKSKSAKAFYISGVLLFDVILGIILIYNIYSQLGIDF